MFITPDVLTTANFQADIDAVNSIPMMATLLDVICHTTGMGFAAVARVTGDHWITCSVRDDIAFGLKPGDELKVETTICHEIRQSGQPVIIDHVAEDEFYCSHHAPALYGFQSYISMPIILKDGRFFGTLCSIDPRPARLNTPEIIGMFKLFSELIAFHLNSIEELKNTQAELEEEHKTAKLREQFIAILGHDLRNPVGAVLNSAQLLLRMPVEDRVKRLATIMQDSAYRMRGLIDNILDFAQSHLGGGLNLNIQEDQPLTEILNHVVDELTLISPDRSVSLQLDIAEPVSCDGKRIAQLFSNLLSNAITYGEADAPVGVHVASANGQFTLTVSNTGDDIPESTMVHLFQPFSRGRIKSNQKGLGLGLFIASEIAAAHKGKLFATSHNGETSFTLKMPCEPPADSSLV
ncbi:MAG TPA: GAF domain-containing sensor histidine kinase [Mucilaginibacter sp.]|nr:GAF domain-containing sensor histidine kinase [Mucilaginibacter sp.]